MYRGKYKICWTQDINTLDKFMRRVTIKHESFTYKDTISQTTDYIRDLLIAGAYDIWIEEVKDDGRDH